MANPTKNDENLVQVFKDFKIRGLKLEKMDGHPQSSEVYEEITELFQANLGPGNKVNLDLFSNMAYSFRLTNKANFTMAVMLYYFLFNLDDYLDGNPQDFGDWVDHFENSKLGILCPMTTKLEKIFKCLLEKRKLLWPDDDFWAKNLDIISDWVKLYPQMEIYKQGTETLTDQEMLDIRVKDLTFPTPLFLFELDSGLIVTEALAKNKDWITLNKQIGYNIVIVNDLFSLMKEVRDGQGRFNYVYVKMKNNDLTVQDTADILVAEVKETERLMFESGNNLKKFHNANLDIYVKHLIDYSQTNLYWSAICRRYHDGFNFFNNE